MLVFKIRKLYSKRVQTRPQVLPSFLICGQYIKTLESYMNNLGARRDENLEERRAYEIPPSFKFSSFEA
ncbi:hypothetical protein RIR_jg15517.t2 [Rhizophagus irregularis DAOM 181602=DAOM 197198]|nr:hypothetical protein RIR_jg15517.t2 [Rhizophagus irregularis DAOM 181602=DAOM 197198]